MFADKKKNTLSMNRTRISHTTHAKNVPASTSCAIIWKKNSIVKWHQNTREIDDRREKNYWKTTAKIISMNLQVLNQNDTHSERVKLPNMVCSSNQERFDVNVVFKASIFSIFDFFFCVCSGMWWPPKKCAHEQNNLTGVMFELIAVNQRNAHSTGARKQVKKKITYTQNKIPPRQTEKKMGKNIFERSIRKIV